MGSEASTLTGGVLGITGQLIGAKIQSNAVDRATAAQSAEMEKQRVAQKAASDQARSDIQGATAGVRGDVQQGFSDASSALGQYQAQVNDLYGSAQGLYGNAIDAGGMALDSYQKALNGDVSGFQNSPGYEFARQQGEQGIQRAAAAAGSFGSGSNLKDFARFNQGLATQNYQQYLGNLQGLMNYGAQARDQKSNLYQNQAQMNMGVGTNLANLAANRGNTLANYSYNTGQSLSNASLGQFNSALAQQAIGLAGQGQMIQGNIWGNAWAQSGQIGADTFQQLAQIEQQNKAQAGQLLSSFFKMGGM